MSNRFRQWYGASGNIHSFNRFRQWVHRTSKNISQVAGSPLIDEAKLTSNHEGYWDRYKVSIDDNI
jgi:hypothetical protein